MKILKYILSLYLAIAFTSCQDFEELSQDPNRPVSAPASLVFNGILNAMYDSPWSLEHRWNQYWSCNYNYYGTNEYSWQNASLNYFNLKNVLKMEEEALKSTGKVVNPYSALGKFFRAYFFVDMTQQVGDLPLNEALDINNLRPKYNTQKEIYQKSLQWLEEANTDLKTLIAANDQSLLGDIYLGNNLLSWRKVVNTYKLRVLISLSKKENDADLGIKAKFAQILSNPNEYPIMGGPSDNLEYKYNTTVNFYPKNPGNIGFDSQRYNMCATYLNGLTALNDPRAFAVATPAQAKLNAGVQPTDFAAFVGAPAAEGLDDMTFKAGNGEYSFINQKRYYSTFLGPEPGIQIGYAEMCFNLAEGINRGWATGDAEAYYNNGIRASMLLYGIFDGANIAITNKEQATLTTVSTNVSTYLAQTAVKYQGNNANGLNQILNQKYFALFQHSGLESFYNWRRTGVPTFATGVGTGTPGNAIPKRWKYPNNEKINNTTNYNEALQRQFGNTDDNLMDDLWINKN
ncbi:MAG: SusD/RagB family nutrient-binding outer membrane lipoprotein [Microscillaceae bacterium]|jgi:hypothetical protein|nr:SusD/RagB family nutrient-binding outer membrane lipoprotein [Microscillaceae bacterium]